jgi:glyoxylase-like metal-dependent hydrolase (beta-lactamase superfamily II)
MTLFDAAISENPLYAQAYFYGINYRNVIKYTATYLCHADYLIRPEDEFIDIEGARFKILRLPGHTAEHLGFVTPDSVAYLADALLSDHVLESVRIPYCISCALDLDTKNRIGKMKYDRYIVAHNGVYENISALVKRNIDNILSKVDIIYKIADHYMSMEQILAKTCAALGIRTDSIYKISSSEQSVRVYMEYLIEEGRLVQRANDGIIEYIRTDCT